MKNLLCFLMILAIFKGLNFQVLKQTHHSREWQSICSILSCQPILERCVRNNCEGKDNCRNCVQSENPTCLRCVDGLLNNEDFLVNGIQTIACDVNNIQHQTVCNFYCRIKESFFSKCEIRDNYPVCNCGLPLGSLIGKILNKVL
jgi:hypothetical protein